MRVLPRHLAGPGHADLKTIWPFPSDDGWHLHQGLEGMVFAISPCARLWTRFAPKPEERGQGTWSIGMDRVPFGPRAWEITFAATTPAELLRDVHAELLDLYLEDRHGDQNHLFEDATAPHEVYSEPHWQARFSAGAPTTLAAAFTASLISTEPLHRAVKHIPFHTRRHLYAAPAGAPQPLNRPTPAIPPTGHTTGRTR
ncbi:DUF317 domain-containing protein [Streptomyces sp. KMM 9044]|uniref:DUF317 domain-containing protein n=1 Tax=Streptomyces sp. KMM 9044 TaxID=2744474 RepID=UPI002151F323|nr:DUF317 domain-containing protein [Streptomyces sp. KMM 9044]WAX77034.1 DUF317 domain-containing protein [Streptomyces sp. KMM 9044]